MRQTLGFAVSGDGAVVIEWMEPHEQGVHEGIRRRGRRA